MTEYVCIGVPYWLGKKDDYGGAVDVIRDSGIAEEIGAQWVDVQPDFASHADPVIAVNRALADAIRAHPDRVPIIFTGDCTSCLGVMKGLEAQHPAIVWFDSHGDFNTPETSPSGFLGGMPLAALVGIGSQNLMAGLELTPIPESDVIISDARNLDPEEADLVAGSQVKHLPSIHDLLTIDLPDKPIYVHFDGDVVDSAEMPALAYPEPHGPTMEETAATLRRIAHDGQIAGVLFTLWDDRLPGGKVSRGHILRLVRDFVAANAAP